MKLIEVVILTGVMMLALMLTSVCVSGVQYVAAEARPDEPDIEYVEDEPGKDEDEKPADPFGRRRRKRPDAVIGTVRLSNGGKLNGEIYLTRDRKLRFYHRQEKKLLLLTLAELDHVECRVVVERMQPEWRWKENANDEKVYTGKHYPMREYETVLHFKNGRTLVGDCTALIYVRNENGEVRFIIHKRQKGKVGQKLSDLVYVKLVDFRKPTGPDEKKKKE